MPQPQECAIIEKQTNRSMSAEEKSVNKPSSEELLSEDQIIDQIITKMKTEQDRDGACYTLEYGSKALEIIEVNETAYCTYILTLPHRNAQRKEKKTKLVYCTKQPKRY